MFRDLTIGQYLPGNSFIHRLDPRTKILAGLAFLAFVFTARTGPGYALATAFTFLPIAVSGVPLGYLVRGLRPVLPLLVITALLSGFSVPGDVLLRLGSLRLTEQGLIQAGLITYRIALLIMGVSLVTLTTSPIQLTDGLERLLGPLRRVGFPAHELAMMMIIALRFIPTLLGEADRIIKAQVSRGASFDGGRLGARLRALVPVLIPLFVSAFRRADELAMAMEARCYRGGEGRTRMRQLRLGMVDGLAGLVTAAWVGGMLWLR